MIFYLVMTLSIVNESFRKCKESQNSKNINKMYFRKVLLKFLLKANKE